MAQIHNLGVRATIQTLGMPDDETPSGFIFAFEVHSLDGLNGESTGTYDTIGWFGPYKTREEAKAALHIVGERMGKDLEKQGAVFTGGTKEIDQGDPETDASVN